MRISDWSSDVCSSDLETLHIARGEMRAIGCDNGGRYGSMIGGVHAPAPAMGKAAKAHQRCDIHIPVNIGSLGEHPDHSRPLPPVQHGEGATSQLYFTAIGGPQHCTAGQLTAYP